VWNKSGLVYPNVKVEALDCITQVQHNIRSATYNAAIDMICIVTNDDNLLFYQRAGLVLHKQVSLLIFFMTWVKHQLIVYFSRGFEFEFLY